MHEINKSMNRAVLGAYPSMLIQEVQGVLWPAPGILARLCPADTR